MYSSNQNDATSSEGYARYATATNDPNPYATNGLPRHHQQQQYRNFDPYSIYSEEEDVWFSEERLFEVSFLQWIHEFIIDSLFPPLALDGEPIKQQVA